MRFVKLDKESIGICSICDVNASHQYSIEGESGHLDVCEVCIYIFEEDNLIQDLIQELMISMLKTKKSIGSN